MSQKGNEKKKEMTQQTGTMVQNTAAISKREQRRKEYLKNKRKTRQKKKKVQAKEPPKEADPIVEDVEIEYVRAEDLKEEDPGFSEFAQVFEKFADPKDLTSKNNENHEGEHDIEDKNEKKDDGLLDLSSDEEDPKKISNRQRRKTSRLSVAELKQLVDKPEHVEAWDVTSSDPRLLVYLKGYRNTVPVPRHWCQRRRYLQGKRGIEKVPYNLPEFIADTGIAKIRDAYQEREDSKKLKQKMKDRTRPKVGRIDIDYQVLYDAFFKYQTKPKLTKHGDIYYEGKEFESEAKNRRPGDFSQELKIMLGMHEKSPPPWLINMQRVGPPPAYPNLKIPGLNAPIPPGCQYGFHEGGWGKPPVDEFGRPLYGDVFGSALDETAGFNEKSEENKKLWGEIGEDDYESSAEDEEEEEHQVDEEVQPPLPPEPEPRIPGTETDMTGFVSTTTGLATPAEVDLRKKPLGIDTDERIATDRPLYQVLEQTSTTVGGGLMGTSHTYAVPTGVPNVPLTKAKGPTATLKGPEEGVEVALDPQELEGLDEATLKRKYERQVQIEKQKNQKDSFVDMVAEQAAKADRKRKAHQDRKEGGKKYKF